MATDVVPTVEVPITMPTTMFQQVKDLAAEMGLSAEELVELALKNFLAQQHIEQSLPSPSEAASDLDAEEVFREHRRAYQRRRLMADEDNAW